MGAYGSPENLNFIREKPSRQSTVGKPIGKSWLFYYVIAGIIFFAACILLDDGNRARGLSCGMILFGVTALSFGVIFAIVHAVRKQGKSWAKKMITLSAVIFIVGVIALGVNSVDSNYPGSEDASAKAALTSPVDYKASCSSSITYDDAARTPDKYSGTRVHFKGEVIQVMENNGDNAYRINVTEGQYENWSDTIYVKFSLPDGDSRILENDNVDIYGELNGLQTYKTVFGSTVTVPFLNAQYIDAIEK